MGELHKITVKVADQFVDITGDYQYCQMLLKDSGKIAQFLQSNINSGKLTIQSSTKNINLEIISTEPISLRNECDETLVSYADTAEYEQQTGNANNKRFNDDEIETLISAVSIKEELWNFKKPLCERTKQLKDTLWEEVSAELGYRYTVDEMKTKWASLVKQFKKVKSDDKSYKPSGSGFKKSKPWKFYDSLTFLDVLDSDRTPKKKSKVEDDANSAQASTSTSAPNKENIQQSDDEIDINQNLGFLRIFYKRMTSQQRSDLTMYTVGRANEMLNNK